MCVALKYLIVAKKHNKRKCINCRGIVIDLAFSRAYKEQCILFAVLLAALRECVELAASRDSTKLAALCACGLARLLLAASRDRPSVELAALCI